MSLRTKWTMFGILIQTCACVGPPQVTVNYRTLPTDFNRPPNIFVLDHSLASDHTLQYLVTRDSVTILIDYDVTNSKEVTIYNQSIDDLTAARFAKFITMLQIDTLRDSYIGPGVCGHTRLVFVQDQFRRQKSIRLINSHHQTVDTLVAEIRNLIKDEKFRLVR
jgi:hypothetical protein